MIAELWEATEVLFGAFLLVCVAIGRIVAQRLSERRGEALRG